MSSGRNRLVEVEVMCHGKDYEMSGEYERGLGTEMVHAEAKELRVNGDPRSPRGITQR